MKKNHSTKDDHHDGFVSIPSPVSPSGKVKIKDIRLPSLVISKNFTISEIIQEIDQRHPEPNSNSLREWAEAMEIAARVHPKENIFSSQKEEEVIAAILQLALVSPDELHVIRQIMKNGFLSDNIHSAAKKQFRKSIDKK